MIKRAAAQDDNDYVMDYAIPGAIATAGVGALGYGAYKGYGKLKGLINPKVEQEIAQATSTVGRAEGLKNFLKKYKKPLMIGGGIVGGAGLSILGARKVIPTFMVDVHKQYKDILEKDLDTALSHAIHKQPVVVGGPIHINWLRKEAPYLTESWNKLHDPIFQAPLGIHKKMTERIKDSFEQGLDDIANVDHDIVKVPHISEVTKAKNIPGETERLMQQANQIKNPKWRARVTEMIKTEGFSETFHNVRSTLDSINFH